LYLGGQATGEEDVKGGSIHMRDHQTGSDALVLLHSLGADASSWDRVLDALPADVLVLRPETPGHGAAPDVEAHGVPVWIEAIREQVRRSTVGRVHLVGVSMGGFQAIAYAATYPNEVSSIIVSDSFLCLSDEVVRARLDAIDELIGESGMSGYAAHYVDTTLTDSVPEEHRCRLRDAIAGIPAESFRKAAASCFGADVRSLVDRVTCPTLVAIGDQDTKTPLQLSEQVSSALGQARIVIIPGSGHLPNLDAPEHFARIIEDFVHTLPDVEKSPNHP
jgi:3-oxoadipate enol-lactonase